MRPKFYLNQGRRCAQTVMKSVLDSFVPMNELESLTGRKGMQITTPIQMVYGFLQLGLEPLYFVKPCFANLSLEEFKEQVLRDFGEGVYKRTNFESIDKAWEFLKESGKYNPKESFDLSDLEGHKSRGRTPLVLIDYDIFVGREDKKSGHYLLVNEMNKESVNVMDCGPCDASPNKIITRKRLEDSLMQTPLDYGILLV